MADVKEIKVPDTNATDKVPDTKPPEVSNTLAPEKVTPKPLTNGLYLVVFETAWDCYNATEQAAFEKATAEHLVARKLARYVPATAA